MGTPSTDEDEGEDEDVDLSIWFSDQPETSASAISDTDVNLEMPGWLADLVEIADTEPLTIETDETGEASWLDDLPAADELDAMSISNDDDDLPDWLTGLRSDAEIESLETDIELDIPDALTDQPATETPAPETTQPEPDRPDDADLDMPDWLTDQSNPDTRQSETLQLETDTSDDDLDMPDWLADLPEPPEVKQAAAQRLQTDDLAMPGWLSSPLYTDTDAEETEPSHSEAATSHQEQPEPDDDDVPIWLAVLRETKGQDVDPNELRYDYNASELERSSAPDTSLDDSTLIAASLAAQVQPTADADTIPETDAFDADDNLDTPAWLQESPDDTVEPEPAQSDSDTFDGDADLDTPAWLADLPATEDSSEPDSDVDLALPPWLADQPDTDETDADTDLDAPAWLTDFADDDDEESSEPDTGADLAMPPWLSDEPDTDEADVDTDLAVPDWLADLSDADESPQSDTDTDLTMPDWLADQPDDAAEAESPHFVAQSLDDATPALAWLAHDAEPETPAADEAEPIGSELDELETETLTAETVPIEADATETRQTEADELEAKLLAAETMPIEADAAETDQPETDEAEAETLVAEKMPVEADVAEPNQAEPDELEAAGTIAEDSGEDLVMPDWLFKGSLEELDTPEWLQDLPDIDQPGDETSSAWTTDLAETTDEDDEALTAMAGSYTTASERLGLVVPVQEPAPPPPEHSEPPRETPPEELVAMSGAPTESAGNLSGWLDALRTGEKTDLEDDDQQIAETTGMLAGLGGLMPAETLFTPSTKGPADDLDLAAQKFYEIATQPPQPATLPKPLSHRARLAGRAVRAVFLLIFIGLVTLPLIPATQKVVNGIPVPWTEPTNNFSTVLDDQRHQLISEQLGIVDVQQPGSVALVSFDYSPATQGEMQPLAQAVLGRLAGQGMRIIAVSLEPEGPPMAQQTIETILADRDQVDQYGQDVVNLGYLPGQVAAVRALASGRTFDTLTDFTNGEPFGSQTQADWSGIENIEQVDLVVTLADNPTSARWWIEQMETAPQSDQRSILAATSAVANPFLRPYRQSEQLDGLISGVEGAAAIESVRNNFGPARRMLDSQSLAHLIIIILIAVGTMVGWMPQDTPAPKKEEKLKPAPSSSPEPPPVQNEPLPDDEDEPEPQE
ncbi:MAG: hypothetical protein H6633_13960 [Anaerolineales bacterium]|nr:hypothetical protein [Anaerolineales bacterium]